MTAPQQVPGVVPAPRRVLSTSQAAGFHANHIAGSPADRAPVPQQGILDVSSQTGGRASRSAALFGLRVLRRCDRCDHTFLAAGAHDRWCGCCQMPVGVAA